MDFLLNELICENTMLTIDMKSKIYAVICSEAKSEHDKIS